MTTSPAAENRPGIQSVEVAARILAALAETSAPVTLTALSQASGMPVAKVHRYLISLTRSGLAHQERESGRYGIGPLAIRLGLAGLRQVDVVRAAGDALPALRDAIDETVALAVWANRGPTVVRIEESGQPVTMNIRAGSVLPLTRSAIGIAFLATLPEAATAPLAAAEEAPPGLSMRVAETRGRGLAISDGLVLPGVSALAAPILDHEDRAAAVIAVVGRQAELDIAPDGAPARALMAAAGAVSARLGHAA